jgi:hypothetical protein
LIDDHIAGVHWYSTGTPRLSTTLIVNSPQVVDDTVEEEKKSEEEKQSEAVEAAVAPIVGPHKANITIDFALQFKTAEEAQQEEALI